MPVGESLSTLTDITRIEREYRLSMYLMIIVGALAWPVNVAYHVIGNPQIRASFIKLLRQRKGWS
jgi:hypothetical protein